MARDALAVDLRIDMDTAPRVYPGVSITRTVRPCQSIVSPPRTGLGQRDGLAENPAGLIRVIVETCHAVVLPELPNVRE